VSSSANFSYFLTDNISVDLGLPIKWGINPKTRAEIGLKIGTTYYTSTYDFVIPYIGFDITPKIRLAKNDNEFLFSSGLNLGALIGLAQNLSLDIGLKPVLYFKLSEKQFWSFEIPFGFIGIRAFFNRF
jgi:outer membrane protein W